MNTSDYNSLYDFMQEFGGMVAHADKYNFLCMRLISFLKKEMENISDAQERQKLYHERMGARKTCYVCFYKDKCDHFKKLYKSEEYEQR